MRIHSFLILLLISTSPLSLMGVASVKQVEVTPIQEIEIIVGIANGILEIDPQGNFILSLNVTIVLTQGEISVYDDSDINSEIKINLNERGYYKIIMLTSTVGKVIIKSTSIPNSLLIFYALLVLLAVIFFLFNNKIEVFL